MFDVLVTGPARAARAALAFPAALGLHALVLVGFASFGVTRVERVDPPPIPVRFVSATAALSEATSPEPDAEPAPPPERPRLLVVDPGARRPSAEPSGLQPMSVTPREELGDGRDLPASGRESHAAKVRKPRPESAPGALFGVAGGDGAEMGEVPLQVGGAVSAPEILTQVNPVYPEQALAAGKEGLVIVSAVINALGDVEAVRVLTGDPELSQAAVNAIHRWRFRPGLLNGEAVKVAFTLTVRFIIQPRGQVGPPAPDGLQPAHHGSLPATAPAPQDASAPPPEGSPATAAQP